MFWALLRSMRPHQWVKNFFVAAPLLFSKSLGEGALLLTTVAAFAIFSLLSATVYLINDLFDIERDRQHPVKRYRPIASGQLPLTAARGAAAATLFLSLGAAFSIGLPFFAVAAGYLLLNLAYSLALKHIPILDVLSIAGGFLLRVLAGALAIRVNASPWLLGCTFVLACYLGFGKRAHELAVAERRAEGQRPVLARYSMRWLTIALWSSAAATCACYAMYTVAPQTQEAFGTRALLYTVPFAIFGVLRFVRLAHRRTRAESPTDAMLRDLPFMLNLVAWAIVVVGIIYVV